jgi:Holliday junction DNA helicase RuvA
MLEFIRGRVEAVHEDAAVISIGGVGIRVMMPTADLSKMTGDVTVHTVLQIKDEDVNLYGFATERAREMFRALQNAKGVGPKAALSLLSFHGVEGLERAIVAADIGAVALAPGVGKKTAEHVVLELKDKLGSVVEQVITAVGERSAIADVREGLKGLGYSPQEIQEALADLPPDGDVPTLMRHALRALGRDHASGNGSRP